MQGECSGRTVYVPQIRRLKPSPQSDAIRRWDLWEGTGHEGGALMNGNGALMRELAGAPSPLSQEGGHL